MSKFACPASKTWRLTKRLIVLSLVPLLTLGSLTPALADTSTTQTSTPTQIQRLAGNDRFATAVDIAQAGWTSANTVVLARGNDFPDALAGATLAHSSKVNGPLLLTDSSSLTPETWQEIQNLHAQNVYLLGGPGAISPTVESFLENQHLNVTRIAGADRYGTAAQIASAAVSTSTSAFLASGNSFADALSISSYAASQGIPLLLSDTNQVPQATLAALKQLGVHSITIIGGTGVISQAVESQLQNLGYSVNRLAGSDRYATNMDVLNHFNMNNSQIYVATGANFPDALSGAALAAQGNHPVCLIPSQGLSANTTSYLNTWRTSGSSFTLLGGFGVISYGMESLIRTGSAQARISLQYWDGYSSYNTYLKELNLIPGNATDYVDFLAPNWIDSVNSNGTYTGRWDASSPYYTELASAAHQRGLKVLPLITSDGSIIDPLLANATARNNLVQNLSKMVQNTNSDGIVIDFELLSDTDGPNLDQFMQSLYAALHSQNKIVVLTVGPKTASTPWYAEFDYPKLIQDCDYLDIMTYDYHYSTSAPGPIAPLANVEEALNYAQSQGIDMNKVLMGLPYYGRDWTESNGSWSSTSLSLSDALATAAAHKVTTLQRDTSGGDSAGVPYYTYTDSNSVVHTVYFDDLISWDTKLKLLDQYNLGGIGAWSLSWVSSDTAQQLFPLLQEYLR